MATSAISKSSMELLISYEIDLKDFSKGRARYHTVMREQLVAHKGEEQEPEVQAATTAAREALEVAWMEYVGSSQAYFTRAIRSVLRGLQPPREGGGGTGTVSMEDSLSIAGAGPLGLDASITLTGGEGSATRQSSMISSAGGGNKTTAYGSLSSSPLTRRAMRFNDLCVLCEKWYYLNENVFELPEVNSIVQLVATNISSVSVLYRLLSLRAAMLCAGHDSFLSQLLALPEVPQWMGLCGDREMDAELDGLMELMERMLELYQRDAKAYPPVPFGWFYRIVSILDTREEMPNVPPKRRMQAVHVAIRLLEVMPAEATAIRLHTLLLHACCERGRLSPEEVRNVIRTVLFLFDRPDTRRFIPHGDIGVLFSPFIAFPIEEETAATPAVLARLNCSKDVVLQVLSTWVGSLWIAAETNCLRSLIDVLYLPGDVDRKMVILSLFNNLLARLAPHRGILKMEEWEGVEEDRRRRISQEMEALAADLNTNISMSNTSYVNGMGGAAGGSIATSVGDDMLLMPLNGLDGALGDDDGEDYVPSTKSLGYHVMDPLLGRALLILIYHGLPRALISMLNQSTSRVVMEATSTLLQDLFRLMDTMLPTASVTRLHAAFTKAVGKLASAGGTVIHGLGAQLAHNFKMKGGFGSLLESGVLWSQNTAPAIGSDGALVDDETFQAMLDNTRVARNRLNASAWNFDVLLALISGPLQHRWRLLAAQELLRPVVAFYTPRLAGESSAIRNFTTMPVADVSYGMCFVGVALMDLLLASHPGVGLLVQAHYPEAVGSMLRSVRLGRSPVFTPDRVSNRVGQTILRMVGRLSAYANGLLLMRQFGLFESVDSLFAKLQVSRPSLTGTATSSPTAVTNASMPMNSSPTSNSRSGGGATTAANSPLMSFCSASESEAGVLHDVCYQLLQFLFIGAVPNYGVCEDVRYTFRRALKSPSNAIRLGATNQLRKALWRDLSTSLQWGIDTILIALEDDFYSVVESAFRLLLSVCLCSDEGLDYFIARSPSVIMDSAVITSHAKELNLTALLYRVAGRVEGLRFLQRYGWVEKELARWVETESALYLRMVTRLQHGDVSPGATGGAGSGRGGDGGGGSGSNVTDNSLSFGSPSSAYAPSFNPYGQRRRHQRSYSDSMSLYSPAGHHAHHLPIYSTSTIFGSDFFPVHFAAVLCRTTEGAAIFKKSALWERSVAAVMAQPQPPDVGQEDASSDGSQSGLDDDSDDDDNDDADDGTGGDDRTVEGGGGGGGAASTATAGGGGGGGGGGGSHYVDLHQSPTQRRDDGASGTFNGNTGDNRGANGNRNGGTTSAWELKQLEAGQLVSSAQNMTYSAARGYRPATQFFSFDCVGDIALLKESLVCLAEVASSDVGGAMVADVPFLLNQLVAISRFASCLSVRAVAVLGASVAARSKHTAETMVERGYRVTHETNAYVSDAGVPYAVSFAHMKPRKELALAISRSRQPNIVTRHAYAYYSGEGTFGIPRRVWKLLFSLCNPVSREGAKTTLYKIMKKHPQLFLQPEVRRLCIDIPSIYRMRHEERKFIASLLESAQKQRPPS